MALIRNDLALALASKTPGLGLDHGVLKNIPAVHQVYLRWGRLHTDKTACRFTTQWTPISFHKNCLRQLNHWLLVFITITNDRWQRQLSVTEKGLIYQTTDDMLQNTLILLCYT